jgi:predicted permease
MKFLRHLLFFTRRRKLADDLAEEMETHRLMRRDAMARDGVSDPDAGSHRALGNVTLAMDDVRDVWVSRVLSGLVRDVRLACRVLMRQPVFAIAAILTIATGVAALTSVWAVVYAVLLRLPPYPNADRVVQIVQVVKGRARSEVSAVDVKAVREASPSFSHVSLAWFSEASITGTSLPERAKLVYTDADGFAMLGTPPMFGRLPLRADETAGTPVVVIGHALFERRFGGNPSIVGQTIRINAQPHTVISVMPPEFKFPAPYFSAGDLWIMRGPDHPSWPTTRVRTMLAFGALAEGASLERAQAEVDAAARSLNAARPEEGVIGLKLTRWAESVQAGSRPRLMFILSAAAVVFLIVCANIANLLLSRNLDRRREMITRASIGAGRARLVRQLTTETVVLFTAGGVAGLVAAIWATRFIVTMRSFSIPRMDEAVIDVPVALTALATVVLLAAIVGCLVALQATGVVQEQAPDPSTRGTTQGARWRRVQAALVGAEVALALGIVSSAGILLDGAWKQSGITAGFDGRDVYHARLSLPRDRYKEGPAQAAFHARLLDRLRAIPGVTSAAVIDVPPGVGGTSEPSFALHDDPPLTGDEGLRSANIRLISSGYFDVLGLNPREGHVDIVGAASPMVVVNEAFVRTYLKGRPAVGESIRVRARGAAVPLQDRMIAGVVPDVKDETLYASTPPVIFLPLDAGDSTRMAIVLRRPGGFTGLATEVRRAVAGADPELAAFGFMGLQELMQSELSLNKLSLNLVAILAVVAVALAIIGVYAVTAHGVRQQRREISIRLALGADPKGVPLLFVRRTLPVIVIGLAIGAIVAVTSAGTIRSLVYGVRETSAVTFAVAALVLAAVVMVSCYLPARRASRVDPALVLRSE